LTIRGGYSVLKSSRSLPVARSFVAALRARGAAEVAGATLSVLAALVDKSFLSCSREGRYAVHELARQYGAAQLAKLQEVAQTRDGRGT